MNTPLPRGFPASPSATVCDHLAGHASKGRETALPPEPLDLAAFYGLPVRPYVRKESPKLPAPVALGVWTCDREEKKIPMSFSPPRFKQTRNGPREQKWVLLLVTMTVTVTTPISSFAFIATNRGQTVTRGDRRLPLAMVRADLCKLLGDAQGEAACAELESVLAPVRPPPASKVRAVTVAETAKVAADTAARIASETEADTRRRALNGTAETAARRLARRGW